MNPNQGRAVDAVVFDLFGTLVSAPTRAERHHAAARVAAVAGCATSVVDQYFRRSWRVRHNGDLPTVEILAEHLVDKIGAAPTVAVPVATELRALVAARLRPDDSVIVALKSLRANAVRLGLLSDASAEIAEAWPSSPLAAVVGTAAFSCRVGRVKPDPMLYARMTETLAVRADRVLYVGDGGGDELHGALAAGMSAVAVRRRGPRDALVFGAGAAPWDGDLLDGVEQVAAYLGSIE